MRGGSAALAIVVAWVGAQGCVLSIDPGRACGDRFIDVRAGEECEPEIDESEYPCGSARLVSGCDPDTCQCTFCGDDVRDPGEECDGTDLGGRLCADGSDAYRCIDCTLDNALCPTCGNGKEDPGEECDPRAPIEASAGPTLCSSLVNNFFKDYASGTTTTCQEDCTWARSACGFCGDDDLDETLTVEGHTTGREVCDGELVRQEMFSTHCKDVCTGSIQTPLSYDCDFDCNARCTGLVEVAEPNCCRPKGELCPTGGTDICCYELDPANAGEEPCQSVMDGAVQRQECK